MSLLDALGGASSDAAAGAPNCSRAGCLSPATSRIDWRNPKIHTGERFKTWLACDEHVLFLSEFLGARSFAVAVHALDSGVSGVEVPGRGGDAASAAVAPALPSTAAPTAAEAAL